MVGSWLLTLPLAVVLAALLHLVIRFAAVAP
jgi:phosphate/sulfate permease